MSNAGWWATTILGAIGAVLTPIVASCPYGSEVCTILVGLSSAISLLLGVTHTGVSLTPQATPKP